VFEDEFAKVVCMGVVTVASLFAGGGGWEVGAILAGCKPVWASELQQDIADVHTAALPDSVVFVGDVTDLSPDEVTPVDILCVSPPCQGYSVARKAHSLPDRDDMLVGAEAVRFVQKLRPPVVLLENVPAYAKSSVFKQIVASLTEQGYKVDWRNVYAPTYGVPSKRRRLVLRASLAPLPLWPAPMRELPTWYDALEDLLPSLPSAGKKLPDYMQRTLDKTNPPMGVPLLLWSGGAQRHTATGERVLWVAAGNPGPVITATFKSIGTSRILLPDGSSYKFTARCAARLQSFPDWYPLPDDNVLAFKVVGNAVPPLLAKAMIDSMLNPEHEADSLLDWFEVG